MYRYDQYDVQIVKERIAQYRDQVRRRLSGELAEDEFRPLRLQNGLYLQRHAYMLRVAVPYGLLNAQQMRMFGEIARKHDRGYGHFTTRQNIQYNWITLPRIGVRPMPPPTITRKPVSPASLRMTVKARSCTAVAARSSTAPLKAILNLRGR